MEAKNLNKKLLEYSLLAKITIRVLAIGILFGFGITQMPALIFITSSLVCALGFVTFYRSYSLQKNSKEIVAFLMLEVGIIIFNMLYMSVGSPLTVELYDTLLTGSVLDIMINVILVAYARKQHKYTIIESEATTIKNVRRSKKAYVRPLQNLEIR